MYVLEKDLGENVSLFYWVFYGILFTTQLMGVAKRACGVGGRETEVEIGCIKVLQTLDNKILKRKKLLAVNWISTGNHQTRSSGYGLKTRTKVRESMDENNAIRKAEHLSALNE